MMMRIALESKSMRHETQDVEIAGSVVLEVVVDALVAFLKAVLRLLMRHQPPHPIVVFRSGEGVVSAVTWELLLMLVSPVAVRRW